MSKNFNNGVWPVMLTPFSDDNRVDYDSLEKLIRGEKPENKNYCLPVELVFRDSVKKITE